MFSYFRKEQKQKSLYFQLDYEFKKINEDEKISGIYAIFKEDICLYVGQSKNIQSRIATHLSGKYKECTKILIFSIVDKDNDLTPLEKFAMQQLKPIENLMVDFTEEIKEEDLAEGSIVYGMEKAEVYNEEFNILSNADIEIINTKYDIFISHEAHVDLYSDVRATQYLIETINLIIDRRREVVEK